WLDQSVSLWDLESCKLVRQFSLTTGEKRYIVGLQFSPDGRTLTAGNYHGHVQSWDLKSGKERNAIKLVDPDKPNPEFVYMNRMWLSPDGKEARTTERVFTDRGEAGRLAAWHVETRQIVAQLTFPTWPSVEWSASGKLVGVSQKQEFAVCDART